MICDACGHPAHMHGTMRLRGHCRAEGGDCVCPFYQAAPASTCDPYPPEVAP